MEGGRLESFKDLVVWQKSINLFNNIIQALDPLPSKRVIYVITDQIIRAAGSISANIAEGFGRKTGGEFRNHLGISRGSLNETEDWLIKLEKLGFIPKEIYIQRSEEIIEIRKMLNALMAKVN